MAYAPGGVKGLNKYGSRYILTNQTIRQRIVLPISEIHYTKNRNGNEKFADILALRGRFPHQTRSLTKTVVRDLESTTLT